MWGFKALPAQIMSGIQAGASLDYGQRLNYCICSHDFQFPFHRDGPCNSPLFSPKSNKPFLEELLFGGVFSPAHWMLCGI